VSQRFATRNLAIAFVLFLRAGWPQTLAARENPYDVLGKALMPIANVFAVGPDGEPIPHALVLDAHLIEASQLPAAFQNQAVHLALMTPDAVLLQAPIAGQLLTVCRNGDTLWATPGSKIEPLLAAAEAKFSEKKKKKRASAAAKVLGPLVLPVPQKELVFLPILFQVADAGDDTIGTTTCMMLDVQLLQQLSKSLHGENWTARLWVTPEYQIARIALKGPEWSGTIDIDKLAFSPAVPDGTFQPQGTDVLTLTARQFLDLLSRFGSK
jgi:hypothetical protein